MSEIQKSVRKSIFLDVSDNKLLGKEVGFIEVTEWANLEGYDIVIGGTIFPLHKEELKIINKLVKSLEKD